jgi:hypothetical protein
MILTQRQMNFAVPGLKKLKDHINIHSLRRQPNSRQISRLAIQSWNGRWKEFLEGQHHQLEAELEPEGSADTPEARVTKGGTSKSGGCPDGYNHVM